MDERFYKDRARVLRELANEADPLIKIRLLRLANNYDGLITLCDRGQEAKAKFHRRESRQQLADSLARFNWLGVLNNLTIQPVLLNGQSPPCGFHALVSVVSWLVGSALGKLGAVLRIF